MDGIKALSNLRIRTRIAITTVLTTLGILFSLLANLFADSVVNEIYLEQTRNIRMLQHAKNLRVYSLELQRDEKNYLLRKYPVSLYRYYITFDKILFSLDAIKTATPNAGFQEKIAKLYQVLNAHSVHFSKVSDINNKLGLNHKVGLQGAMRHAVHAVENKLAKNQNDALLVKMLMMRRHEKDYILRSLPEYIDHFNARYSEFNTLLDETDYSPGLKAEIRKSLKNYQAGFHAWVLGHQELESEKIQLTESFDALIQLINQLVVETNSIVMATAVDLENNEIMAHSALIIIGIFLLMASAILSLLIGNSIASPIEKVTRVIKSLAKGDMDIQVPEATTRNEISTMLEALAIFKDNAIRVRRLEKEKVDAEIKAKAQLKEKADLLADALAKEKDLNKRQREFIAMASHEFRTPLAIIDGAAQRLKRRAENLRPDETNDRVFKIRNAVQRMTRLMEGTLSMVRLDDGKMTFSIKPCDIRAVVARVCECQQEISQNHNIQQNLSALPESIQADEASIEQIFTNLLSNAVKYSPQSRDIHVSAHKDDKYVFISVKDNGLGIDPDEMKRMFERFFRARTSVGIEGTGIGLNLVKQLVEHHDGSIEVTSIKGEGTTLTVRIPIAGPAEKPDEKNRTETASAYSVV